MDRSGQPTRIVICCDGTWNRPDQRAPTNVTKFALAVADRDRDGREQRLFYHLGVGTRRSDRIRGGAFGVGLSHNIRDCYRFLLDNYTPGDELWFLGFSRGAFTARSLAGLVRKCGILRPPHRDKLRAAFALYRDRGTHPRERESTLFRRSFSDETPIHFIGVWDTVGALGVPLGIRFRTPLSWRWRFHDVDLSTHVRYAYQALAIDERRRPFRPTMWNKQADAPPEQVLEQRWFAGVHSDVGGGYADAELSDVALLWMAERAVAAGLALTPGQLRPVSEVRPEDTARRCDGAIVHPDPDGRLHESRTGIYRMMPPHVRRPLREPIPEDDAVVACCQEVAPSVWRRMEDQPAYRPPGLAVPAAV